MRDPNPLATGPTKWRAERCTAHHHACDCREFESAEAIGRLDEENERLRDAVLMARNVFEGYAALHREKGTDDGNAKGALNQDLAARMTAALQPNALVQPPRRRSAGTIC